MTTTMVKCRRGREEILVTPTLISAQKRALMFDSKSLLPYAICVQILSPVCVCWGRCPVLTKAFFLHEFSSRCQLITHTLSKVWGWFEHGLTSVFSYFAFPTCFIPRSACERENGLTE